MEAIEVSSLLLALASCNYSFLLPQSCHEEALAAVNSITAQPSLEQIEYAAACHLTKDTTNQK